LADSFIISNNGLNVKPKFAFLWVFMIEWAKELKKIRETSGLSQQKWAEKIGIPQKTWSNYENGRTRPKMDFLFALAERGYPIKGLTTGVLQDLEDQGKVNKAESQRRLEIAKAFPPEMPAEDFDRAVDAVDRNPKKTGKNLLKLYHPSNLPEGSFVVPLLDQKLSAGLGAYLPEEDEVKALIRVPGYLARYGENIAALAVDGDSMEPTLHRGDMVVCDSCGWSGEGIYAVRMSGSGFVKRITKRPGRVVVISDNPKYPPQEEPEGSEDFQIIGRVHCAITKVE
jgi:phage repressor protein C with HTH and peptisase S24 domain/DNA-binding XRE family transcriptional regulator